jgi:hypothetical protein
MAITYRGERFSGFNKPKRTPGHKTKSHAVLAKVGDTIKLIRFGQQGVSGAGKNPQSAKSRLEENLFKARHAKNIRLKVSCQQLIGLIKCGKEIGMSLYDNINKRKKAGTSRSKKKSTISSKAYANMKAGFPKKKKKK